MNLAAGFAALVLGLATLRRGSARARSRLFALLCAALALWNVVYAVSRAGLVIGRFWSSVYLLGSCASAPLGLHFALSLARATPSMRRRLLPPAYAVAALLWLTSLTPAHDAQPTWNGVAIGVLGAILAAALGVLGLHARSLAPGPEKRAFRLLLLGAIGAVAVGLSDLVPRHDSGVPRLGPLAILVFLVIVCAVVTRYRYLDLSRFIARVLALALGSAAGAIVLHFVVRWSGERLLPIWIATVSLLALAGPVGRMTLSGVRKFRRDVPLGRALSSLSRRLADAASLEEIRSAVEKEIRAWPSRLSVVVFASSRSRPGYEPLFRFRGQGLPRSGRDPAALIDPAAALPRLLVAEREAVTRRLLEDRAVDGNTHERDLASGALAEMQGMRLELVAPLLKGQTLRGWIGLSGEVPQGLSGPEGIAGLVAVANQALASVERIEALEVAKRREALAAVGEMAAGLAHELRNPLAAIHGAAQVLATARESPRAAEMLEVIEQETARLGLVVGEFLEYARPASPRREPVDLADLAARALRSAESAGWGLQARIEADPDAPPALADPDQVHRSFLNLIRNAREAAGADGALVVRVAAAGPGRVAVQFEDDGPGIPADELPRLFQPFHTTKPGGTGLGLALVHRIVESHGGEVRAEGRAGRGAVFTLALPAAGRADGQGRVVAPADPAVPAPAPRESDDPARPAPPAERSRLER